MTITYKDKGELGKPRLNEGGFAGAPVPEEEITPRVARLLAIFERPKHKPASTAEGKQG